MKHTLIALLATVALVFTSSARVIVYKQKYAQTDTGMYKTATVVLTGYMLVDDAGDLMQIDVNVKDKTYQEYTYSSNFVVHYLQSTATAQVLSIAVPDPVADAGTFFLKGTVASLPDGVATFNAPKTMIISGAEVVGTDPLATLREWKGMLVFDSIDTVAANKAGNDISQTAVVLETALSGKGYTLTKLSKTIKAVK